MKALISVLLLAIFFIGVAFTVNIFAYKNEHKWPIVEPLPGER